MIIITILFFAGLITAEIIQWVRYDYAAPLDFEQCRINSYGCKETAEYLSQLPNVENHGIITDDRMTVDVYLNYYLLSKGKISKYYCFWRPAPYGDLNGEQETIYVLWAPESHPKDYWNGLFRDAYDNFFRPRYSKEVPIGTIYYPNGLAAIHIFKVRGVSLKDIYRNKWK